MTKAEERAAPGSVWNRTGATEPVFVLVGRDVLMAEVIQDWIDRARRQGANEEKIAEAEAFIPKVLDWQAKHGTKVPD